MTSAPDLYVLTDITRKSSEQRRVVLSGFDVRWRTVVICMMGGPIGIILAAFFWVFIGEGAILFIPLSIGALFYLIDGKSKQGLGLPMWRALLDRKKSSVGKFYMCGIEIDPLATPSVNCVRSTVPIARDRAGILDQSTGGL